MTNTTPDKKEKIETQIVELMKFINSDIKLQSLLYDLDLLPEQLKRDSKKWGQMICIACHWKYKANAPVPAVQSQWIRFNPAANRGNETREI